MVVIDAGHGGHDPGTVSPHGGKYEKDVVLAIAKAVRDQLVALHHAANAEVTVVPLWQTVDFFVYNKRLRNIGEQPVWLYQNVDQWRLSAPAE